MRKDEAAAQLAKQQFDVRRVIGPNTTPYIFWKRWSAACGRNEFGLVNDMMLPGSELAEKFHNAEDFFVIFNEIGLPYEGRWNLDKIKLTETTCRFLCHRTDSDDKNADVVVSMMTLRRTDAGYRVEDIRKTIFRPGASNIMSFNLFDVPSAEADYLKKLGTGWVRPDLTDAATRFVAPQD